MMPLSLSEFIFIVISAFSLLRARSASLAMSARMVERIENGAASRRRSDCGWE